RKGAAAVGDNAEVTGYVEVGAQPTPREEIPVGLLGLRAAEEVVSKVLAALPSLPADGQPNVLIGTQRNELQAVPEVVGLVEVDAAQHRPVFVESSSRSDLIGGPLRLARRLTGLCPGERHALDH